MLVATDIHYVLPLSVPTALIVLALAIALVGWVWSHRLKSPVKPSARAGLTALQALAGVATMLAAAQVAQRWLLLTTNWSIWPLAVLGALAVEAVLVLYRLERGTVSPRTGKALTALRVAAVLLVAAMLAQPVRALDQSQEIQRVVAVLVDESASMRIHDTQLTGSEKVRLAESLWQGPQRPYRLEASAAALSDLQVRLRAQADALGVLREAKIDLRQQQMAAGQDKLHKELAEESASLDQELADVDAPLHNNAAMVDAIRMALLDVKTRLGAKVAPALQRAVGLTDAKNIDSLGANHPALLAALHQAAGELAEIAPRLEECAGGLDESFYNSLPPAEKAAVDAAAGRTRIEHVRQALLSAPPPKDAKDKPLSVLDQLQAKYLLKLYTFDSTVSQMSPHTWAKRGEARAAAATTSPASQPATQPAAEPAPTAPKDAAPAADDPSEGTDIAGAMRKVLSDLGGEKLAGVVIVSDGRHNGKNSIDSAMRQVSLQQAPVCSIVAGSSRPPMDAAIVALEAPETVYAHDKMLINAQVKLDGLAGRTAHVQLWDGPTMTDSQTIQIPSDSFRTFVSLSDTPEAAGVHSYRVQVNHFDGEAFDDNNTYPLTLSVTEDRARLLMIEERPRWEFRYLKNLFAGRDNSVRLQYVLLAADQIEGIPAAAPVAASASRPPDQVEAYALPANEAEWMKFDVIILGDVPPRRFTAEQLGFLRKFVVDRGGTLVVIAGPDFMPLSYAGTALAELLPVRLSGGDKSDQASLEPSFRIALTEEGSQHVIMRQAMDRDANNQMWTLLPELYWRCPILGVKPGSSVLAYAMPPSPPAYMQGQAPAGAEIAASTATSTSTSAPSSLQAEETMRMRDEFQKTHALVVANRVAMGQVLFMGFDSTWRMRYRTGDTYHHKFWGQVLRWATAAKLPGGTSLVKVGTDRARYSPHAKIVARAKIQKQDFSPLVANDVAVKVFSGKQLVLRKNLAYTADSPGLYWAELGELPSGTYRLELSAPSAKPMLDQDKVETVATEFSVDPSTPAEQVELSADRALLGQIASSTGGIVAELYEAPRVLGALGPGTLATHEVRQYTLWDCWWFLTLIISLVTAEWLLRKKVGLA
jgi:hypothetical protein